MIKANQNINAYYNTNAYYAQTTAFRKVCQMFLDKTQKDLPLEKIATRRQASKFRRGMGVVYKTLNNLPI